MFIRVLDCVTTDHNPLLVVLALVVAFFSGFTLFSIIDHVRSRNDYTKAVWTGVAAFVAGGGIWSTHFIAMLGFHPAAMVSYNVGLTVISAVLASGFAGIAIPLMLAKTSSVALAGSLVLGAAIGIMHFTGMRALLFAGTLEWDSTLVGVSLGAGVVLVAAATFVERRRAFLPYRLAAGLVFGSAICVLHFTAMSAAVVKADPSLDGLGGSLSEFRLGLSVAVVTASIVICCLVTMLFDRRAHNAATETRRIRSILEATQTGMVLCQDDRVISANRAFERLVEQDGSMVEGHAVTDFIELPASDPCYTRYPRQTEAQVKTAGGTMVDIALCLTPVTAERPLRYLLEVRDIGDQKRAREQIMHLANHDALTGLPNRRLLDAELRRTAVAEEEFSLLWIDLDHFKEINDTHGHAAGDTVLREVAHRFRSVLEEHHLLARIGGDEFVVLVRPAAGQSNPDGAAESLLNAMTSPIVIDDQILNVGLSIGSASYPHDAKSLEALMQKADRALYEAKRTGRSRYARVA